MKGDQLRRGGRGDIIERRRDETKWWESRRGRDGRSRMQRTRVLFARDAQAMRVRVRARAMNPRVRAEGGRVCVWRGVEWSGAQRPHTARRLAISGTRCIRRTFAALPRVPRPSRRRAGSPLFSATFQLIIFSYTCK